jgi:hypothetical protein
VFISVRGPKLPTSQNSAFNTNVIARAATQSWVTLDFRFLDLRFSCPCSPKKSTYLFQLARFGRAVLDGSVGAQNSRARRCGCRAFATHNVHSTGIYM